MTNRSNPANQIQAFGLMLVIELETGKILQASENAADFLDAPGKKLLGNTLQKLLGHTIYHDLRNQAATAQFTSGRAWIGRITIGEDTHAVYAFQSGENAVVEVEPYGDDLTDPDDRVSEMLIATQQMGMCRTEQDLLNRTIELLRFMTGYERVSAYEFGPEGHAILRAEAMNAAPRPLQDRPPLNRDDLAPIGALPLRIIADAAQKPVAMRTRQKKVDPVDLSQAALRCASAPELDHLKHVGMASMMSLCISVDSTEWGFFLFHDSIAKRPSITVRRYLEVILPAFQLRLETLLQAAQIARLTQLDQAGADIEAEIDQTKPFTQALSITANRFMDVFEADSFAYFDGTSHDVFGKPLDPTFLQTFEQTIHLDAREIRASDDLRDLWPDDALQAVDPAGFISIPLEEGRRCVLFRNAPMRSQAHNVLGTDHRSLPWGKQHLWLADRLQGILTSAERYHRINQLGSQQTALVDEINLKVRNSMSVIRAVARHARKDNVSTETYANVLEGRIRILSDVHGFGAEASKSGVSLRGIIKAEARSHALSDDTAINIDGPDWILKSQAAPLLALSIHELMTNAAQFGALSAPDGRVDINLARKNGGVALRWQESGGPAVCDPVEVGFGATLVRDAVSFELGGASTLEFRPTGVFAELWLPDQLFQGSHAARILLNPRVPQILLDTKTISASEKKLRIMVVEDNFMIAMDVCGALKNLGFEDISVASNERQAIDQISQRRPDLAILDINLSNETTSFSVAEKLQNEMIPFVFMTGYGENIALPQGLRHSDILAKPLSSDDLIHWILKVIRQKPKRAHQLGGPLIA